MSKVNLAVNIGGLEMKNPVTTASGTFGSGLEMVEYVDLSRLGAVTIKGTTLEPRPGNPQPRIAETPSGMLNSIGLENPGVEVICRDVLPKVAEYKSPIIVNIAGREIEDYGKVAAILEKDDNCAAIEVNVSCPNVKNGGMALGTNPDLIYETTKLVKENTTKPVIIKLSPNVTNIVEMAQAAERGGADALTLINCLLGTAIDIKTRKPIIANVVAGLSGPAIKPVALRMVYQVSQAVNLPIIGLGGIICWEDAVEFLLAGATGVSVGTGNFVDPSLTMKVIDGIEQYLIDNGFDDVNDIIGLAWRK
ncbi:MAG: dihydroorotate dehydrogenase [Firmicutes bacterium]|nr:dihydroorotate dehydrogenase [Bacillota bacterium]MBQ4092124.1 dihydroorotate dehydrogenase [Bacillota bacterium]MBQ6810144.1 dihydroorotate dehydrogenase [Bacillota bacterium]